MRKKPFPILIFESISKYPRRGFKRSKIDISDSYGNFSDPAESISSNRVTNFYFLIIIMVAIFLFRLFYLTVIKGEENRILSDENRIRLVDIEAARGPILDRGGRIVADSGRELFLQKGPKFTHISESQARELCVNL